MVPTMHQGVALGVFGTWLILAGFLLRLGIPLGSTILWASVGISLALGRGFMSLAQDSFVITFDLQNLELFAIVILIYQLSFLLKNTGRMERIAAYLKFRLRDPRWVLMVVPALVGLIPMPGGAMFTAPITDEMADKIRISPEDRVFSNYWFRHCWELSLPVYPGIILCAGLMKTSPLEIFSRFYPLTLAAFCFGLVLCYCRWPAPDGPSSEPFRVPVPPVADQGGPGEPNPSFLSLWPILAVVVMGIFKVSLVAGLLGINSALALAEKVPLRKFRDYFVEAFQPPMMVLIWAVFLFGRILATTGLLPILGDFFFQNGFSVWAISFTLPFLVGLLTGVTTGFVGTTFPLLLPLWGSAPLPWAQFAYASGLAGVYLTPSHLCLSLTQDYFKASLGRVEKLLLAPVIGIISFALLRMIQP